MLEIARYLMRIPFAIALTLGAAVVASSTVVVSAGCATATAREPFTDDSPSTPVQMPEQNGAPAKTPQSGPAPTTEGDASTQPDAPDTCKRTAPSNKCGVAPQCGCTLAETCEVQDSTGAVDCIVAGKAALGEACVATAGCSVGLTCIYGTCHAFCGNPGSACTAPKSGDCEQIKDTGGAAIPNLAVCQIACDLRDATGCGATNASGTGVCMVDDKGKTDCAKGGTHTVGQACTPADDCGPTLVCAGTATAGTCKKWCRVSTNDCGGAVVCNGFQTKIMIGTVEYGACP